MDLNKISVEEVIGRMILVFKHAEIEYKFWDNQIKQFGYGHDEGIILAEYYGQMCAIVNLERELLGAHVLADELESLGEPLFAKGEILNFGNERWIPFDAEKPTQKNSRHKQSSI